MVIYLIPSFLVGKVHFYSNAHLSPGAFGLYIDSGGQNLEIGLGRSKGPMLCSTNHEMRCAGAILGKHY